MAREQAQQSAMLAVAKLSEELEHQAKVHRPTFLSVMRQPDAMPKEDRLPIANNVGPVWTKCRSHSHAMCRN